MKTVRYKHPEICLCSCCGGTGVVSVYPQYDTFGQYPETKTCPVCDGCGRTVVRSKTIIEVMPYVVSVAGKDGDIAGG